MYVDLDPYLHEWDEQFHALVSKNLINHPLLPTLYDNPILPYNYKDWSVTHVWLHKPPLTTWIIALSLRLFGMTAFAVRIPSLIFSSLSIYLTYVIGEKLFDKRLAWLAALFQAINGFLIAVAGGRFPTDHVDTIFLFFSKLAFVFAIIFLVKKNFIYLILFSVSVALAIYTKWLVALALIPVWMVLNFEIKSFKKSTFQLAVILTIIAAMTLPWQFYIFHCFPLEANWESNYNFRHFTSVIEGHDGPWYFYIVHATMNWNELIWLAFIWFVIAAIRKKLPRSFLAVLILFLVPYVVFSIAATKMEGFVIIAAPATFIILSYWWWDSYEKAKTIKALKVSTFVLLIAFLVFTIRDSISRVSPLQNDEIEKQITSEIKRFPDQYSNPKTIFLNTRRYIQIMFFTQFIAYRDIPSKEELDKLELNGYDIVVVDDDNLPEGIKSDSKIKIIDL